MQCPSCKTHPLKPARLEEGLPVQSCQACDGAMVSLLHYRDWAEYRHVSELNTESENLQAEPIEQGDSQAALTCPKCARIMSKFAISGCTKNRLDLCNHCDEAWLDGGEWALLKALQLSNAIPRIFTDAWQHKVRTDISEQKLQARFAKLLGEADAEKAADVRAWLKSHKKRADILFYLGQD